MRWLVVRILLALVVLLAPFRLCTAVWWWLFLLGEGVDRPGLPTSRCTSSSFRGVGACGWWSMGGDAAAAAAEEEEDDDDMNGVVVKNEGDATAGTVPPPPPSIIIIIIVSRWCEAVGGPSSSMSEFHVGGVITVCEYECVCVCMQVTIQRLLHQCRRTRKCGVCMCVYTQQLAVRCTLCDCYRKIHIRPKCFLLRYQYRNLQMHIQEGNDRTVPISLNKLLEGIKVRKK
jgi:hypothetical protein